MLISLPTRTSMHSKKAVVGVGDFASQSAELVAHRADKAPV
jgi:hypothetical protein